MRDARTPAQQMVGKCKRSNKLVDRCVVLAKQMLEEQKGEEAALEKAEQHQAKYLELFEEHQKAKEDIEKLSRETYSIIGKRMTREQSSKRCLHQTVITSARKCRIRCWTTTAPSRMASLSCKPCKKEWTNVPNHGGR